MSRQSELERQDFWGGFWWTTLVTFAFAWGLSYIVSGVALEKLGPTDFRARSDEVWSEPFGIAVALAAIAAIAGAAVAPGYAKQKGFQWPLLGFVLGMVAAGIYWYVRLVA